MLNENKDNSPQDQTGDSRNSVDSSRLLSEYHSALANGEITPTNTETPQNLGGAFEALRMLERHRQLTPLIDSETLPTGNAETLAANQEVPIQDGIIGRFKIVRKLGAGGSGVVLQAHDPKLDRTVALKVPLPSALLNDEYVERFQREGRFAGRLRHPNIVSVLETGSVGPIHYIATDYCDGPNLGTWLTSGDRIVDAKPIAKVIHALADAVQHAHSRGILHRDIKPSNILFVRPDDLSSDAAIPAEQLSSCVRLADFGLAKNLTESANLTAVAAIVGTPAYMSPEQASGDLPVVGTHSDIFSLGVVLYEMLTGTSPFLRETNIKTLDAVRRHTPKPFSISKLHNQIPADLEAICFRCLEKRPADRYPTAAALAQDLHCFLNGMPVTARRISLPRRLIRWSRRSPAVATLAGLLVMGTVCAGAMIVQSRDDALRSRGETLDALQESISARQSAEESAFTALKAVHQARLATVELAVKSREEGQRLVALDSIKAVVGLSDRIPLNNTSRTGLRNDAIHALSLMDCETKYRWGFDTSPEKHRETIGDFAGEQYATITNNSVVVRRARDDTVVCELKVGDRRQVVGGLQFSPGNRYLVIGVDSNLRCQVWDLTTKKQLIEFRPNRFYYNDVSTYQSCSFSSDESQLAYCRKNRVHLIDLTTLVDKPLIELQKLGQSVRFDPVGERIAVVSNLKVTLESGQTKSVRGFQIYDLDKPDVPVQEFNTPGTVRPEEVEWSADGRLIAATHAGDRVVRVWDTVNNEQYAVLANHGGAIREIAFHPTNGWLMTSSADGMVRVWDLQTKKADLKFPGTATHFSSDGQRIVLRDSVKQFYEPLSRSDIQTEIGTESKPMTTRLTNSDFVIHPSGRFAVCATVDALIFTNTANWRQEYRFPGEYGPVTFNSAGDAMFADHWFRHVVKFAINVTEQQNGVHVHIGSRQVAAKHPVPQKWPSVTTDAKPAFAAFSGFKKLHLLNRANSTVHAMDFTGSVRFASADVSFDGKFVAAGFQKEPVRIWNPNTGELLETIPLEDTRCKFHPETHLLAVSQCGTTTFFKPNADGTVWNQVHQVGYAHDGFADQVAFSGRGSVVAIQGRERYTTDLLNVDTFETLASFRTRNLSLNQKRWLSPDGRTLITRPELVGMEVTDLSAIHTELKKVDLDWNQPATEPVIEIKHLPLIFSHDSEPGPPAPSEPRLKQR